MSCGVGCRRGSDPALLWLWCRPVATAPIQPLAREPPYAARVALEEAKKKKKNQASIVLPLNPVAQASQVGLVTEVPPPVSTTALGSPLALRPSLQGFVQQEEQTAPAR